MSSPELDVRYVANLARIALSDEETSRFQLQLGKILEHVGQLASLNLDRVDPTAHANPVFNVIRQDQARPGLNVEDAMANAPRKANGLFVVTKVIE